ncbi:repetitive organellar protein [Diorhabda sublineata]|uniref:repetitive organellar protein n=1 Tax=Diorhabda sublineata TaxID=1163346 RepID=UPI0024E07C88|nr:repetitive organellar protein [Diorhabda sublineata]XP_056634826.1 repetitive organellar protein [Diorhabda sublineata]XP_056634827.1 repetitive organellar protein [Diorhabda sublineata]
MIDTDDTDELLLIPPDFFSVQSSSEHSQIEEPYYNVVDNLIKQVGNLRNRLKSIESCDSFCSNSLDRSYECLRKMENGKQTFRKYSSTDDLCTSRSTENSPQKPLAKFKINSLPNSPNTDRYIFKHSRALHHISNPTKKSNKLDKDGQVLTEIDTFLSKVKTIQRINAARNLEMDFNDYSHVKTGQSPPIEKKEPSKSKTSQFGDTNESIHEYESDISPNKVKERELDNKTSIDKDLGVNLDFTQDFLRYNHIPSYTDSSSDSTQITAYNRPRGSGKANLMINPIHSNALNVLNVHKKLLEDSSRKVKSKETYADHKQRSKNTIVGDNLGTQLSLMNLADIWNANNHTLTKTQLTQKLQEEKYKRQHCEEIIQDLQTKNLELQQNMSVAVKVDEAKNVTIKKYQEALEKLIFRIEKLGKEKLDQEFEITKLKSKQNDDKENLIQKMSYYEKEVAALLKVAHGNQEKMATLEQRCIELEKENQTLSKQKEVLEQDYLKECDKYKQLSDILALKELELNENKTTLASARNEISQSKQAVETCQAEFNEMKSEFMKMEHVIEEERALKVQLNNQIADLTEEVQSNKKQQNLLQEELAKSKKQVETNKVELRNFYQGQVELLVQSKLKEFQCQLDETENKFKEEIKKREMAIAKSAATHIQQISEKYSLEIELIEKKHKEETKLYQIQIMQQKQLVESLQNKLDQFQEKRIEIAKQLQKVMESQWNEALKIITSGRSTGSMDESAFATIDQLNNLKTKSYNNLEDVLSQHDEDQLDSCRRQNNKEETRSSNDKSEKLDFHRFLPENDTPVSSRFPLNRPLSGSEFQHFLSLLLNKPPGDFHHEAKETGTIDFSKLQYFQDQEDGKLNQKGQKDRKGPKPPWK